MSEFLESLCLRWQTLILEVVKSRFACPLWSHAEDDDHASGLTSWNVEIITLQEMITNGSV